ncbi:hypothetical protein F5Y00DRAFT_269686 [Daldinia vernicosa]|uniref:uncharacterized protein n=1 Tax=Daldinia vernicosa TaxID=114800 RepID=UPI0020076F55|nr:uncharacterized protein F5Y00DRAFT_269686 [Daldinia vernicosa]KAI0849024.1 hypothetical protein F5Y00DRAFT_269686 [Daldinia vernicosa]
MTWYYSPLALLVAPVKYLLNQMRQLLGARDSPTQIFGGNLATLSPKYAKDEEILADILQEFQMQTTGFVSINAHAWDQDYSKITDIGVCTWREYSFKHVTKSSYHWRIRENMSLKNIYVPNEPDIFAFGSTKIINEFHIAQVIDSVLEPFIAEFPKVIVVGYDIKSTMHLLHTKWKPPESIVFLDTQKLWQIRNHHSDRVDLERALETTPAANYERRLLHNAGNNARYILELI